MGKVDTRRIAVFLLFAFGIAWATGLVIYLTGGLVNSSQIAPGVPLAAVLLPTAYMWAPALGNILTRLLTREGWKDTYLTPYLRLGWFYYVICWFAPGILTLLGVALFFFIFPQYYDPTLGTLRKLMESAAAGRPLPADLWSVALQQIVIGLLIAPILNAVATLGEELGWRAYLLPKLLPLGARWALIVSGLIWGVWHWPIIMMGGEYGFGYWGFPWTGMLLFLVFTTAVGTLIGWATIRTRSVWPAVVGHGAINGIAQAGVLFLKGNPTLLLGPIPNGLVAGLPFVIVALIILFVPRALGSRTEVSLASDETELART